ncbi:MAG: carboxylesterase/lipase family protein [Candidatus Thorarchaeota archaeon]
MATVVETSLGQIQGIQRANHLEFLGIRYAQAPLEDLRFSEPIPVESWKGVYDATKYAPMAPQVWDDDPPIELEESEDCLFLNVYTPGSDQKKRPVLFYIHGGAYAIGSGSRPRLYGGQLAERGDVVVVTIQYRLGPLGFLYMDGIPANLGLKDQICALQWVKQNITLFGGDPDNITIFGQSAGSISVSYLLIMPKAKGLFHRAIAESATFPLQPATPKNATKITNLFLSKLKVDYGDISTLRNLDWSDIIKAQRKIGKDILSENHHGPVLDDISIPSNPLEAIQTGHAQNIPLMIGHTSNELPIFQAYLSSENFLVRSLAKRMISKRIQTFGLKKENLSKILELYRKDLAKTGIPNEEYDLLLTDMGFRLPSVIVADSHSRTKAGTYFYEFAYKAPKLDAAVHVLDLFFVFGTLNTSDISEAMQLLQTNDEKQLSEIMMDTWTEFAKTGNPNQTNLPDWEEYKLDSRNVMIFDIKPKLVSNHLDDRINLWKSLSLL